MKKEIIFLVIIVIGFCFICGCNQSQPIQTVMRTPAPPPVPTPQNQFKVNEPATDGNVRVTFLGTQDGSRTGVEDKTYYITMKFENLRSDKEIIVYPQDFTLYTKDMKDGKVNTDIVYFAVLSQQYRLPPLTYDTANLEFYIPLGSVGSTVKFDFSRSSGVLDGGKVVYFIV